MNYGRSHNLSLKYQRFTPSGCKDMGMKKFGQESITLEAFLSQKKSVNSTTITHPTNPKT